MYSNPITLYGGVNNLIKVQCLNSDQQYLNLSNANITVQAGIFEPGTENELFVVNATDFSANVGLLQLLLTPAQLAPLGFGFYEIALTATDANSNIYPIYINDNYGNRLQTTLLKGPVLAYGNPIPVIFTDQTDIGVASQNINLTQRPMNSTTATLGANLFQYTGNIISSGSMISTPFPNDWANISATYYANVSGNILQSVEGSFAQLRFIVDGIDPSGNGNISFGNVQMIINNGNIRI